MRLCFTLLLTCVYGRRYQDLQVHKQANLLLNDIGMKIMRKLINGINKLHNIVHKQWIYRNTCIHYRGADGFTMPEHNQIINRVEEYSLIDPEDLLPRHQYLLNTDFEALGSGPTIDRQIWLANITSARATARLSQAGTLTQDAVIHFSAI